MGSPAQTDRDRQPYLFVITLEPHDRPVAGGAVHAQIGDLASQSAPLEYCRLKLPVSL